MGLLNDAMRRVSCLTAVADNHLTGGVTGDKVECRTFFFYFLQLFHLFFIFFEGRLYFFFDKRVSNKYCITRD